MYFKELIKGKKWLCIGEGPRDPVTGKRKQVSRRGKSKSEAKAKVERAINELANLRGYHENVLFYDFAENWYTHYRNRGNKENTNITREFGIKQLSRYFGAVPIKQITTKMYQAMLDDLFQSGKSHSTLTIIHTTGRLIFQYALQLHLIKINPADAARVPRKKLTVEEIEQDRIADMFLEREELAEFLEETNRYGNFVYIVLIYVLTFSGARPGEAIALYERDVFRESNQIWISKTMFRRERRKEIFEVTPPKTLTSIRKVDMDPHIIAMIDELIAFKKRNNFAPSPFLFTTPDGMPLTVDQTRQVVRRIGEKTSIKKTLYTYMLRHTHVSMLASLEMSLPEIMKRVGHKNADTTTHIYLHVTKDMRQRTISKMGEAFGDLMKNEKK